MGSKGVSYLINVAVGTGNSEVMCIGVGEKIVDWGNGLSIGDCRLDCRLGNSNWGIGAKKLNKVGDRQAP